MTRESWRCIRQCYFRDKLFIPGEIITGDASEIVRHFVSEITGKEGEFGKKPETTIQPNEKLEAELGYIVDLDNMEKAKRLRTMNKIDLAAYGRELGIVFDSELTRAEMISKCIEKQIELGYSNQAQANELKG